MATDLSNIDSFFGSPQSKITSDCEKQHGANNNDIIHSIKQIRDKINELKISQEPLDVERVVKEIFNIEILETDLGKNVSGFLERIDSKWYIYINKYESKLRKRFTIAHELGHFVCHRNQYVSDGKPDHDQVFFRDDKTNSIEKAANEFAAELLMPENTFNECVNKGINTIEKLADAFQLSTSAVKYRAYKLGYLTEYK
jgi:Zn-dependent peptidase ImmA (M78 family)